MFLALVSGVMSLPTSVVCMGLTANSQIPSLVDDGLLLLFADRESDQFGAPVGSFEP